MTARIYSFAHRCEYPPTEAVRFTAPPAPELIHERAHYREVPDTRAAAVTLGLVIVGGLIGFAFVLTVAEHIGGQIAKWFLP